MGATLSSSASPSPLSLHAPGPNGQASVLPLSNALACEAPRSPTDVRARATLRCPFDDCGIIQFVTSDRHCRKCHRPLDPPVDPPQDEQAASKRPLLRLPSRRSISAVITTTDELDAIAIQAASVSPVCPALARFDQCLPVVLCWLRMRLGLSQSQVAMRAGITRNQLNSFECGRTMPRMETVERLAVAMSTDIVTVMRMCEYLRDGR